MEAVAEYSSYHSLQSNGMNPSSRTSTFSEDEISIIERIKGNLWASGCEECQYGIKNYYNVRRGNAPTYLDKMILYHAGELNFCECRAGQAAKGWHERKDEEMKIEKLEYESFRKMVAERKTSRLFENSGVPPAFQNLEFRTYFEKCKNDPGKRQALSAIQEFYAKNNVGGKRGIMLWGKSDVGKTGSLSPLFVGLLRQTGEGLWIQYNDLLAQLRKFDDGQVDQRMKECQQTKILFIDDLGDPMAEKVSDYSRDVMFRIIDYRCNNNMMTFITSNLSPVQLAGIFHERFVKRLGNICAIIEVSGNAIGVLRT